MNAAYVTVLARFTIADVQTFQMVTATATAMCWMLAAYVGEMAANVAAARTRRRAITTQRRRRMTDRVNLVHVQVVQIHWRATMMKQPPLMMDPVILFRALPLVVRTPTLATMIPLQSSMTAHATT